MFRLPNMLPVFPDPISEFGIASFSLTNVLLFAYWTNSHVNEVFTVICQFQFMKNCLPTFLNVQEISVKSCSRHKRLLSEHLNMPAVLFVNKEFVKVPFRFGGCMN